MNLNITYDALTQATAPAAFYTAVNYVVGLFDQTFSNTATVNIAVGYGDFPQDGSLVTGLGVSNQNNTAFENYSQVGGLLAATGAPAPLRCPPPRRSAAASCSARPNRRRWA